LGRKEVKVKSKKEATTEPYASSVPRCGQLLERRVSKLMLLNSSGLDVRDPWQWEILKCPVAGELLTTKSTVRAAAEDSLDHQELVTDELVNEYWAPMTFHDNRRANYLLERGSTGK